MSAPVTAPASSKPPVRQLAAIEPDQFAEAVP